MQSLVQKRVRRVEPGRLGSLFSGLAGLIQAVVEVAAPHLGGEHLLVLGLSGRLAGEPAHRPALQRAQLEFRGQPRREGH